ncbi:MAG: PQQ-dependent sugar dehydrogenase [Parcubacteria group bacterium]|jgi:glucose/arabinose dehydrogenase
MKKLAFFGLLILAIAIAYGGYFYWQNLRGIAPAVSEPARDITELVPRNSGAEPLVAQNSTGMPLDLPVGFSISIFAKDLPLARMMHFDSSGNMWLSRTRAGAVALLEIKNGQVASQNDIFRGLSNPHGIALDPVDPRVLYIAEENKISKALLNTEAPLQKIADLPSGGGHSTRTLLFGADGRLYVSIGSSCNVCAEKDNRRAKIFSMNKDGSDFREFAKGLRNSVFLATNPRTQEIWATEMGRDLLGDNVPPEEVNVLKAGEDYGWPYCYDNNIHDDNFDPQKNVSCEGKTPPHIAFQAHSAPLGLTFVPENSNWPAEYKNDLLVAYHGSWNRSVPTGYKIVRFELNEQGDVVGKEMDFISNWLQGNEALGRPVDLKFGPDGALYVSDDKAGVIYRVEYNGN